MSDWIRCADSLPYDHLVVLTKIDDEKGCRNETELKRLGNLWFFPDGSMYVYYSPTHWKSAPEKPKGDLLSRVSLLPIQDRADLYAALLGFLKARVGDAAFDEDVQQAVAFLKDRKNTEATTNDQ